MKKVLFILLLVFLSLSLYAESLMLIQGAFVNTSRSYSYGSDKSFQDFSEVGVNIIGFVGKEFGLFSSASFLIPNGTTVKINGTEIAVSLAVYDEMKIGLDAILGLGYKKNNDELSFLLGGGLHFSGIALASKDYSIKSSLSYTLGAGVSGSALYNINEYFNLNLSVLAGYDFIEIMRTPELSTGVDFEGAFTMGISAGLGFSY